MISVTIVVVTKIIMTMIMYVKLMLPDPNRPNINVLWSRHFEFERTTGQGRVVVTEDSEWRNFIREGLVIYEEDTYIMVFEILVYFL